MCNPYKKWILPFCGLFMLTAVLMFSCLGRNGEVMVIMEENGGTAALEELSYQEDCHLTGTIVITLPEEIRVENTERFLKELQQEYAPSISYQGTMRPLVVKRAQLRTEHGTPSVFRMEIDTWLTLNPPAPNCLVEITLNGFSRTFRTILKTDIN